MAAVCTRMLCILIGVNHNVKIRVSLLCIKNKVVPIKTVSIPRLEQQAAHIAVAMDYNVREELLDVILANSTFWRDSMKTLLYINNNTV